MRCFHSFLDLQDLKTSPPDSSVQMRGPARSLEFDLTKRVSLAATPPQTHIAEEPQDVIRLQ